MRAVHLKQPQWTELKLKLSKIRLMKQAGISENNKTLIFFSDEQRKVPNPESAPSAKRLLIICK